MFYIEHRHVMRNGKEYIRTRVKQCKKNHPWANQEVHVYGEAWDRLLGPTVPPLHSTDHVKWIGTQGWEADKEPEAA